MSIHDFDSFISHILVTLNIPTDNHIQVGRGSRKAFHGIAPVATCLPMNGFDVLT